MSHPRGTGTTVRGREPVGAVLRVGRKDPKKGFPTDRDRFFICSPQEVEGVRPPHPAFAWWNKAAENQPERCRSLSANLVHMHIDSAFQHQRRAQKDPQPGASNPPNRRPWCTGDGERAERWNGTEMVAMPCPGDACPFAQQHACKPLATLFFRPRWARDQLPGVELQAPLMKLTTRGEYTSYPALLELWRYVAEQAIGVGLDPGPLGEEPEAGYRLLRDRAVPLYGLPFTINLSERTSQTNRTRFPVLSFSPDGDLLAWLRGTIQLRQQLTAGAETLALPEGAAELTPEEISADYYDVTPGLPAQPGLFGGGR